MHIVLADTGSRRSLFTVGDYETSARYPFSGAILTGGSSSRMGQVKALLPVDGIPMAARVARAMLGAGAKEVFLVGGDVGRLSPLNFKVVPDLKPHEGPLSGIVAALTAATEQVVVVTACDMPWIRAEHVTALVDGVDDFDVLLSAARGVLQPLHAVWKRKERSKLKAAFEQGVRSPLRAIENLNWSSIDLGRGSWSVDLDTPADVTSENERTLRECGP